MIQFRVNAPDLGLSGDASSGFEMTPPVSLSGSYNIGVVFPRMSGRLASPCPQSRPNVVSFLL